MTLKDQRILFAFFYSSRDLFLPYRKPIVLIPVLLYRGFNGISLSGKFRSRRLEIINQSS